jgi:hypothetical protein
MWREMLLEQILLLTLLSSQLRVPGGILITARASSMQISNLATSNHYISVLVWDRRRNLSWMLTWVYGPQGELEKSFSSGNCCN